MSDFGPGSLASLDGEIMPVAEATIPVTDEGLIRGGTDGSRLSEMGLPTPNIFTGAHEFHSVREWASLQDMAAAAATIVRLAGVWARAGAGSGRGTTGAGVAGERGPRAAASS